MAARSLRLILPGDMDSDSQPDIEELLNRIDGIPDPELRAFLSHGFQQWAEGTEKNLEKALGLSYRDRQRYIINRRNRAVTTLVAAYRTSREVLAVIRRPSTAISTEIQSAARKARDLGGDDITLRTIQRIAKERSN